MSNPISHWLSPKLADRYIFQQLIEYFLLGVVVFTLIAFFSDTLLKFMQDVQKYGIPFGTLLTMVGLQLPKSIALVLPAASFLAVLMVFNLLNNQFEIITMRMNGISLYRLMMPAVILGLFCSGLAYVINDYVVPYCNARTVQMRDAIIQSGALPTGGKTFMHQTHDENRNLVQMIYVSSFKGRHLGDSTVIDLSKPNMMQIVQARSGSWDAREGWHFRNANIYLVSNDVQHSSASHWDDFSMKNLLNKREATEKKLEELRGRQSGLSVRSDEQSFPTLFRIIKEREKRGMRVSSNSYLEMWEKVTLPLSCLVIILSAVPLALTPPRQGSNRGFVFAIAILFMYYVLRSVFIALGRAKLFTLGGLIATPYALMLAAWAPLALMTAIGITLVVRKSHVL